MMKELKLSPSIFAADMMHLKDQVAILEKNHVELLHVDVMDGSFVNRIAYGADHIRMIKNGAQLPLDVHLMVSKPERYIESMIHAGADLITVHQESTDMLYHCLQLIKSKGKRAGVALSPATPPGQLEYVMELLDMALIMTVNPGEGKQRFMREMLPKIRKVKEMIGERNIDIEVDGSIDDKTARLCLDAGANVFVSGGYLFSGNLEENLKKLRKALEVSRGDVL